MSNNSQPLPANIELNPELDSWVRIETDGTVVITIGKVEIGQGIKTAVAMIAAEELEVAMERIVIRTAHTTLAPDESITAGSLSIEDSGSAVRVAGATAKELLLARAATEMEVPVETLRIEDGTISSARTNRVTDYWQLQGGECFEHLITRHPKLKPVDQYRIVGGSVGRIDLRTKLTGEPSFIQDLNPSDRVHARIVRPPVPGSVLKTICIDDLNLPGLLKLVRNGSFVGVIAKREEQAIQAALHVNDRCKWSAPVLMHEDDIANDLRSSVISSAAVIDGTPTDDPLRGETVSDKDTTLSATYTRPYQMHASLGPSAAMARYEEGALTLFTHSQWVGSLQQCLATLLPIEETKITVIHAENAGCYGHNGADDAAFDAALLALELPGHSIMLKWTREEEHRYEPYAPAMLVDMAAKLDASGRVVNWRHNLYSYSHNGRPRSSLDGSKLLSTGYLDPPIPVPARQPNLGTHTGSHRNADPLYRFPRKSIVKHFCGAGPLRSSSVRSLGAFSNVFAIESFMDELTVEAGTDPFTFRLQHLEDQRAQDVLRRLRDLLPNQPSADYRGRGIAFSQYKNRQTYAAIAVDVAVKDDGRIELTDVWITADAGLVIDPDGLRNQLEGGFIQSASWSLKEKVSFNETGIHSIDWETYPILDFTEIPRVKTMLIERPDQPSLGAGEATTGPTPAAIANAVYDAIGVRLRDLPFTPERVRAAAL